MFRWITAIFSYIGNIFSLKGRQMEKKANSVYTGSAEGIAAAFEEDEVAAQQEYQEFFDAVSSMEAEAVRQEKEVDGIEDNIEELEESLQGALDAIETAKTDKEKEEATNDANDFAAELEGEKEKLENLKAEIERGGPEREQMKRELVKLKEELVRLPAAKAKAISKFLSKTKMIETQERLAGIRNKRKERKSAMVEAELDQLDAKARVSSEMAGVATEDRRAKYKARGQKTAASSKVADMLAQRAAQRNGTAGVKTDATPAVTTGGNGGDRPEAK